MKLKAFLLALILGMMACNLPIATPTQGPLHTPVPATLTPFSPAATLTAEPTPELPHPTHEFPTSAPIPTLAYQPLFEQAACAFPVPGGYSPECGYLVVPEDRSRPDSTFIRLHVAIFRSRSSTPAPDPVVHLAGGPGSSSLAVAGYMLGQGLSAVLETRDLILFDQRGTGYSLPRLDCPERQALSLVLLEGHLPPDESLSSIQEAFRLCRERLVSNGIDPSAYNSASNAADVNDLRRALGYPQLNLYGVSYGTRLGLTVMRDYPEAVRSAVLDSLYPLQVNLYTSLAPNAERAFSVLFSRCAADPTCSFAYPDLETVFYDLVDRLNVEPLTVNLTAGGGLHRVVVDGGLLIDVLFVGLYNPGVTRYMPRMIYDIRRGEYSILRERLGLYFDTSSAVGMQMSVQCAEEIPFAHPEEAFEVAQRVQPQIADFFPASVEPLFAVCQAWHPTPPDPRENQPVSSHLPALLLAGEFDPITPPEWGRLSAGSLSQAYFFEFPGNGHWVTRSSSCALGMVLAFWDNPTSDPDSTCIHAMGGLDFVR